MTTNLIKEPPPDTPKTVDEQLDEITIRQLTWKPSIAQQIAITICESFIEDRIQWVDNVDLSYVQPGDKNCIGMAWRNLARQDVIERMPDLFKRSESRDRRGGTIFKYRLLSERRARTFIMRNAGTAYRLRQGELPL